MIKLRKKLTQELLKLAEKGIKASLEKQEKVFVLNDKNKKIYEKAKTLASF